MGEPTVQQVFGERLRLLREAQEYTQQQIADVLNVSRSTYTRYENGSSAPSLELTRRLAQILSDGDPRFIMQLCEEPHLPVATDGSGDSPAVSTLMPDEKSLILFYRTLSNEQRSELWEAFRAQSIKLLQTESGDS